MSDRLKEFKNMWEANHWSDSMTEVVNASDIEFLIEKAEQSFNQNELKIITELLFKEGLELGRLKGLNDGKNQKLRKLYADKQDAIIKLYNKTKAKVDGGEG